MKRCARAVIAGFIAFSSLAVAESVEHRLKNLENDWAQAEVRKDFAALDRFMADEYIFTDPDGVVFTKAQNLASFKSEQNAVTSELLSEVAVQDFGNAAVVTGLTKETVKGRPGSDTYRFTDTWVKRSGSWQCVAGHASRVTKP